MSTPPKEVLNWLLAGDVSIQYQTYRDLLNDDRPELRDRIAKEGWGADFLKCRNPNGSWGQHFYQPKWISSHYTLLDLKNLAIAPDHKLIRESIHNIATSVKRAEGGIYPISSEQKCDICVNGMFLNYACYFGEPEEQLRSIIDFILNEQMPDGGFNCQKNRQGARHSSLHSTLSVLEGIEEYLANGYRHCAKELRLAAEQAREFILLHRFFKSDHTGQIIQKDFLKLTFPPRWKYNILRALDHFRTANVPWDERMSDALEVIVSKRNTDGRWPVVAAHSGKVHFTMEKPRDPSRWNTLIALRVFKFYHATHT